MEFLFKTPAAGTIRIGRPPGQSGTNYPVKLGYFEFCKPGRTQSGFFEKDAVMHEIFGTAPTVIGPLFFVSDNPIESIGISLDWWGGSVGKAKRKCYKLIDPLTGVVDDGRPASRLMVTKEGEAYHDFNCLSDKCPDYGPKKCGKSLRYRFYLPQSPRLGEYSLTVHSFLAISSALGMINMLKLKMFQDDSGILYGLSKIPFYFRLEQGSARFKGKDTPMWYPIPYIDQQAGALTFLERLAKEEVKLLSASIKNIRRAQVATSERLLLLTNAIEEMEEDIKEEEVVEEVVEELKEEVAIEEEQVIEQQEEQDVPEELIEQEDVQVDVQVIDIKEEIVEEEKEDPLMNLIEKNLEMDYHDETFYGKWYKRIEEKDGISSVEVLDLKSISEIPEGFEEMENAPGIYFKQTGKRTVEVDLIITSKEVGELFEDCTWNRRPQKLYSMIVSRDLDYAINALRNNQK